jgi:Zn-finger nucleic acid-binding protein
MKAWALYSSQDGDRSFQGNEGYEDKLGEYLSYDNQVANSLQVKEGDRILIIDGSLVYGTSLVDRITSGPANKVMKVCPECETTTLSPRKTLLGSKCTKCKKVWDAPKTITKVVTAFRAYYGPRWEPFNPPLSRDAFNLPFANNAVQNAIRPLDGDALALRLGTPSPGDEVEQELGVLLGNPRKGRGFAPGLTAAQKRAIEVRAMEATKKALEADGWKVEDTSQGNPFDLRARRSGIEMHVEVKGTCTTGEKVILTRGEVKHHHNTTAVSALAVVSGIELTGTKEAPEAKKGTLRIISPWVIDPANLDPLAFEYSVP